MFTPNDIKELVRAASRVSKEYDSSESDYFTEDSDATATRITDENLEALKLAVSAFSDIV